MTWDPVRDRAWRREAIPRISEVCQRTWHPQYENILEEILEFVVARIEGCMGVMKGSDCIVYFDHVPLFNVTITNPERVEKSMKGYPQLQQILQYDRSIDSLPVVLRRIGGKFAVWDGHHRLFTYQNAGRTYIPAIVAWFVPGTGQVKVISRASADPPAQGTGSPAPESLG